MCEIKQTWQGLVTKAGFTDGQEKDLDQLRGIVE